MSWLPLNADGSFTYTPTAGFTGIDSFTYTADDGQGGTANATVTIDVQGLPGGIASDDFSGSSLDAAWSLQGPVGTANLASDAQDAYLEIVVPDGGTYDAWGASNTTVRLMQAAAGGDFGVEARFLSTPSQRFEIQGILVEQDAQNWIRFDTFHDGGALRTTAMVSPGLTNSPKRAILSCPSTAKYFARR